MKVETGTIAIVRIDGLIDDPRYQLDPVRVMLEDIGPGQGRITIECWGKAWASYWGGMGGRTIAQFFAACSNQYLIGNLAPQMNPTRFSGEALAQHARKTICLRRRFRDTSTICRFDQLDKEEARDLFNDTDDLDYCETPSSCWSHSELLTKVFGSEWFHSLGRESEEQNPDYEYLQRICSAVREALKQIEVTA